MNSNNCSADFQDRINRMNAWRSEQKLADEEFIRKQKIRMFINDCDEIRPKLRNQLLVDSKLCQLEQMKEQQKQREMKRDVDEAWNEVRYRGNFQRNERENFISNCRMQEGRAIQDFQKIQMADKIEISLKIYEDINEERKNYEKMSQEDYEQKQEMIRASSKTRKVIGEDIVAQIGANYENRKRQLENELKMDQIINNKICAELKKSQHAEQSEREQFRRDVFGYLDHLMVTREHNKNVEREKEKLIEDIRVQADEDQWKQRCEKVQKRQIVNKVARIGQVEEMKRREKERIEEISKQKHENDVFNQRESLVRQNLKETAWQQRLKAFHYGNELLEQRKNEELRNLAEKQKLDESLMLIAQERERCETMGREFVDSYQDVLSLHPNLFIIQQGKKN